MSKFKLGLQLYSVRDEMEKDMESMSADELKKEIADVTKQMKKAAADLNFELAAQLRDRMVELKKHLHEVED